ncbi:MAG: FMN-binding protein, partial [Clostridia bacterium]|nr:FMN-binding protein [Clostridia bacterium]
MIKNIKNTAILVCVCTVITLLLALTNSITAPVIEENANASANAALLEVMPEGSGFDAVDLSSYELPATVTEVYKENGGLGYVIKLVTAGYGTDMVIMCGVGTDGIVTGAVCLSSNETLGKEKTYGENFVDQNAEGVEAVDTVASATKTTEAYKNAIKDALNAAVILEGGSVDIRTEEEILADALKEALPAGDTFTKVFMVEVIEGADAVYAAENQAGYVFVAGEQFIGVDAEGKVLTANAENA